MLIIVVIVIVIYMFSKSQKEGFWAWNYAYGTPCVQDMFGYVSCDPMYTYMYPGYYTPNPYLYNSPEVMYRRILY